MLLARSTTPKSILLSPVVLLSFVLRMGADGAQAQGVTSHAPRRALAAGPSGPALSRLPLISEGVFPLGGADSQRAAQPLGEPGAVRGYSSDESPPRSEAGEVAPSAFGTLKWPYTMARVANKIRGRVNSPAKVPVTGYPFRATGKLWMRFGGSWFICTASLIKKSLLVTAAHCVHNYGQRAAGWASEVRFYPANASNSLTAAQPYGVFTALKMFIPTTYFRGTDTCRAGAIGVVCNNDLAVIVLRE